MALQLKSLQLIKVPSLGEHIRTEGVLWQSPVICVRVVGKFQLWRVKSHTRWDANIGESTVEKSEYLIVFIDDDLCARVIYAEQPGREWHSRMKVLERVIKMLNFRGVEILAEITITEIEDTGDGEDKNLIVTLQHN